MAESIGLEPAISSDDNASSTGVFRDGDNYWMNGGGFATKIQSGYGALVSITEGSGKYMYNATVVCAAGRSASAVMSGGSVYLNVHISLTGDVNITCTWDSSYIDNVETPVVAIIPLAPI